MVSGGNGHTLGAMFPTLSVTLIGLLVGAAVMLVTRTGWRALLVGLAGAWVGFGIGALVGLAADIILGTGVGVALAGHVLALVGASIAARALLARQTPTYR